MDGSLWLKSPGVQDMDPLSLIWPEENEERALLNNGAERLCMWVHAAGAKDLHIQAGEPAKVKLYNKLFPVMSRPVTQREIENIATYVYGAGVQPWLNAGNDFRVKKTVKVRMDETGGRVIGERRPLLGNREVRLNYRWHGAANKLNGANSIRLTARVVKQQVPSYDELGIEQEIIEASKPQDGLVLVTGKPGQGKSTVEAAIKRSYFEDSAYYGKHIELAQPQEYLFEQYFNDRMMYTVSEIGRGENYACSIAAMEGTFSAAPDVVYAPEMISKTAIHLALLSANAGVTTYSTLHTAGTSATVVRVLSPFDLEEREERAMALMDSLRLIVSCRLVPSVDGREVQLREFLPFSRTTREELLSVPYQQWPPLIQSLTQSRGQTWNQAAQIAADEGRISHDVANLVMEGR